MCAANRNVVNNDSDETLLPIFRPSKLKLEAAGYSETMINTHQTSQGQKTENCNVSLIASSFLPSMIRPKPVQQQK
jgi:hypothetical protein